MKVQIETQDAPPVVEEDLERVGVSNLKTLILINWKGKEHRFLPEIEITIDLDKSRKGAHMSRLVESISECIEKEVRVTYDSIEELERKILEELRSRHLYKKAEIFMKTELVIERKTPATKKKTLENYDINVAVVSNNGLWKKILKAEVYGSSACPHAMKKDGVRTHIQRSLGVLEIETDFENKIDLVDMINVVEKSFSSEVYTLLKTEDENYVVNKMFKNPKFVEDITREMLHRAKEKFKGSLIKAGVKNFESIHKHNVIAEGRCIT